MQLSLGEFEGMLGFWLEGRKRKPGGEPGFYPRRWKSYTITSCAIRGA